MNNAHNRLTYLEEQLGDATQFSDKTYRIIKIIKKNNLSHASFSRDTTTTPPLLPFSLHSFSDAVSRNENK